MSDSSKTFYRDVRKKPHEFESREDFLNHDLTVMSFRRWGIHLPSRDYSIEIEDWVPALAATIGKVVMVTAMVAAFAAQFGLSPELLQKTCVTNCLLQALCSLSCFPPS